MDAPLLNRELSWLEFNHRVLAQAADGSVPLMERVKFLAIAASNLDEFLTVRVGALHQLIASGIRERSPDGRTPKQQLKEVRQQIRQLLTELDAVFARMRPELQKNGIRIESAESLSQKQRAALAEEFASMVAPVLTPLAVDPGHPFPFLASGALNVAVLLEAAGEIHTAFIKVPRVQPRFIAVPGTPHRYLPVEELIRLQASYFFPGLEVKAVVPFRVVRNLDIALQEEEIEDLLKSVETELRLRERKEVIWIETSGHSSELVLPMLQSELGVAREDVHHSHGPMKLGDLMELVNLPGAGSLRDEPFNPRIPAQLATRADIFSIMRAGDVLLHRPYESYSAIVELIQTAADDPEVVAIKQTLYRTEPGSLVVDALARAAERGKQVTAVVEVQARFDEERNIAWARRLEEAGVQVVYGLVGIKTHCKMCLVIRREGGVLRRYVHLSTGNYNARTAQQYTDFDLLTTDEAFGHDATQLMNVLTGYSVGTAQELFDSAAPEWTWQRFVVAPMDYHAWTLRMIDRETQNARAGLPSGIIAKLNSLVEPRVIEALLRAAEAGVKVDLLVRGICCLLPRENIRVISIVDRFLEHSRALLFRNAGKTEIYVTSGDWMPRNFFRRIEVAWPIVSPQLRDRIEHQILAISLSDDVKAWKLRPDGKYERRKPRAQGVRAQQRFIEIARAEAVRLGPAEEAMKRPREVRRKKRKKFGSP
ncbi:MAG: polyphosphate kinase [Acidobacteriota bacterium]|nr:polyphosphate kinase [Acidobacteriota bacterium]